MSSYHPFVPPMGQARYFGRTHSQVMESLPAQRLELWKTRLEGLRSHESAVIDTYVREQSHLHAAEADRDWMTREAFNKAPSNATVGPPGGGA